MTGKTRAISVVTAITIIFVLLFSVIYIAAEANHDCIGENCPICEQMAICQQHLQELSGGAALLIIELFAFFPLYVLSAKPVGFQRLFTLITLKVKLLA